MLCSIIRLAFLYLAVLSCIGRSLVSSLPSKYKTRYTVQKATRLDVETLLLPPPTGFDICILDKGDLSDAATLAIDGFFQNTLSTSDNSNFIVRGFNALERWDAWLSNFVGFRTRLGRRPVITEQHTPLYPLFSRESILVAAVSSGSDVRIPSLHREAFEQRNSNRSKKGMDEKVVQGALLGIVELSLEPANGQLSYITLQDLLGQSSKDTSSMQPYLCNLCVDSGYRRLGIGQYLCKVCERIAVQYWERPDMYLHVRANNAAAVRMYEKMGYKRSAVKAFVGGDEPYEVLYYHKGLPKA